MAARYIITLRDDGKMVGLHYACRISQAQEIAQAHVLRLGARGASAEIVRRSDEKVRMRYWWDDGLQYMEF